jgi:tetratricopeptide (TPR) repeat protein
MADDKKTPPQASAPDPHEGPGKGKAFFDRAKSVAATGNFDYAIDMYLEGLFREPFNVDEHKALREVAMRRKIAGGKSGGGLLGSLGGAKLKYKGKTPKEALLNNTFTLARDVGNINAMLAIIRNADILGLKDLILWMGQLLKEANRTSKPKVEIYSELAEIYGKYKEFERACDAVNEAMQLKPDDSDLSGLMNQYAAQATLERGKYDQADSFRDSIKDTAGTRKLIEDDNLVKSNEYLHNALATAKADYEANPKELQVINKYYKALVEMDEEEYENQAIDLLRKAFEETKIYRLKMAVGDVRMKQLRRNLRVMRDAVRADPHDKDMLHQYQQLDKERVAFELAEFRERAEHMPTDLNVKFDLGVRLWESKKYDEAIMAFQEAQNNPKHRVDALHFLGRSFLFQGMKPEAVETLKRSIDEYELAATGDKKSKELHYWYARASEDNGQLAEAVDIYSKVVQWDIGYADARKRMTDLRAQLGK